MLLSNRTYEHIQSSISSVQMGSLKYFMYDVYIYVYIVDGSLL